VFWKGLPARLTALTPFLRPPREAGPHPSGVITAGPRQLPLAGHLALLCLVLLVPVLLLSGSLVQIYLTAQRGVLRHEALSRAQSIMTLLERDMEGQVAALQVMAANLALEAPDAASFSRQARTAGSLLGGRILLHRTEDGRAARTAPVISAPGAAPPADDQGSFARARRDRAPAISGLVRMGPGEAFSVVITVPVLRDNQVASLLSLAMNPDRLLERLRQVRLPEGWVALIVDGQRHIMVRSERQEEFQGRLISEAAQEASGAASNFWSGRSMTGEPVLVASAFSSELGWRTGILVPARIAEAPLRRSLWLLGAGAGLLAALAIGLAVIFARRIAHPVQQLVRMAQQLGRGTAVQPIATPIREVSEVGAALAEASKALRQREKALAESEARLARALHAARIGTWDWEVETDVLTGSVGCEALYGVAEEHMPTHAAMEAAVHPEDRGLLRAAVAAALDPAGPGHYDALFRVVWPDGRIRWLHRQGAVVERRLDGRPLRLSGVVMDVTPAQEAAERERQLASEVDHRARNVLTVVQSVLRMSRADDPTRFAEAVKGRVAALARAHTLLASGQWLGSEFHSVAGEALGVYHQSGRISLKGPALTIAAHAVQPLVLVLHELATNAAQYGSLSGDQGQVLLSWMRLEDSLILCWRESGGPPVREAPGQGFGLKVVENTVRRQLGGTVEIRWEPAGVNCRMRFEATRVVQQGSGTPPAMLLPGHPGPMPLRA